MHERIENIRDLIVKHIQKEISAKEHLELQQWIDASEKNKRLFEELIQLPLLYRKLNDFDRYDFEKDDLWKEIEENLGTDTRAPLPFLGRRWVKYAAAAAVVLIGASAYFWFNNARPGKDKEQEIVAKVEKDVLPNTKNAVLTLDDGSTIILDSTRTGMLATQGDMKVVKKANGQLVYEGNAVTGRQTGSPLTFNTITVPKGSDVVFVTLSDG